MAANHRIQVTLDESTGQVKVRHFCVTEVGGVPITTHEDVPISPEGEASIKKYFAGLIDVNRETMEQMSTRAAITHVATVAGRSKGKQLRLAGEIKPTGSEVQ